MGNARIIAGAITVVLVSANSIAVAQAPQTMRLRGVIEKVDGKTVMAKSEKGEQLKLNLADKMLVVDVVKASIADIKPGSFIGSGAMPQPMARRKRSRFTFSQTLCAALAKASGRGTVLPTAP
jgi:hypothetical protein